MSAVLAAINQLKQQMQLSCVLSAALAKNIYRLLKKE